MKRILIAVSAMSLAAAGAFAQKSSSTPSAGAMGHSSSQSSTAGDHATMKSLDKDKDGSISKSEAAADPALAKSFVSLDKNKDGKLSASEFAAYSSAKEKAGAASKSD